MKAKDPFVVPAPRVTDAIGSSLRHAFERDHRLPAELSRMLGLLEKVH